MIRAAACLLAVVVGAALIPALAADSQGGAPVVTITPQTATGPSLEARVSKLERVVEGQALADLLVRIQRLQEDLQRLRGDLEVQANDINGIKQRQRDLYLDIDRRLRQLEVSASTGVQPQQRAAVPSAPPAAQEPAVVPTVPSFAPPTAPGTVASAPPVTTQPNPEQEQADYQKAFDLLKENRYDDAIAGFRDMLTNYPNGKLSDNAQYWIGEANFASRRFRESADEFNKVINNYPQSTKVPDAMLKLGFSYYELGDWAKARQTLEQLIARNPQSTAAQLADKRLQKMKSEGH